MNYISKIARHAAALGITAMLAGAPVASGKHAYENPSYGNRVEYGAQKSQAKPPKRPAQKKAAPKILTLEQKIESYFKSLKTGGYLNPTDSLFVTVHDTDTGRRHASINEDREIMAASTIKDFVMLAYYDQVQRGGIKNTKKDERLLRTMIQRSSNGATNQIINRVGGPAAVEAVLGARYPFFDETDVREYIPNGGRTYRNKTSTHDLNIFYNQLWHNRFPIRRDLHEKMKGHLAAPKTDRLYDRTCIPEGMKVWNKTGTVYGQVSDSGILQFKDDKGQYHRYIVSVAIEDRTKTDTDNRDESYRKWVKERAEVIRSISEGVYDFMATMYNGGYMCEQHKGRHLGSLQ